MPRSRSTASTREPGPISTSERPRQLFGPAGPPASDDVVGLGAGQDLASITASNLAGSLDGGPGLNSLVVYDVTEHEFLPWRFDNVAGVATFDGKPRYHWTAFRRFNFPRTGPVHFQGSDAAEVIRASEDAVGSVPILQLDMAGGDDRVVLFGFNTPVRGGRGSDFLRLLGFVDERTRTFARRVMVDLPRGVVHVSSSGTDELVGVENVELDGFLDRRAGRQQRSEPLRGRPSVRDDHARSGWCRQPVHEAVPRLSS